MLFEKESKNKCFQVHVPATERVSMFAQNQALKT